MSAFETALEIEEKNNDETLKTEIVEEKNVPVTVDVKANVTVNDSLPDYAILNPELPMKMKIGVAGEVASCLKEVIEKQGLIIKGLNPKNKEAEYVTVEGWEVLGTMLGITPVTKVIETQYNKQGRVVGYKSQGILYRNAVVDEDGNISGDIIAIAEASADKHGFQKDLPSIMSMSQTRALGKAYRMALSWIIKMAGYEGTPAQEMPNFTGVKNNE